MTNDPRSSATPQVASEVERLCRRLIREAQAAWDRDHARLQRRFADFDRLLERQRQERAAAEADGSMHDGQERGDAAAWNTCPLHVCKVVNGKRSAVA